MSTPLAQPAENAAEGGLTRLLNDPGWRPAVVAGTVTCAMTSDAQLDNPRVRRTTGRHSRAARFTAAFGRFFEIVDTDVLSRDAGEPVPIAKARVELNVQRVTAGTSRWEQLVPKARLRDVRKFFARDDVGWIARVNGRFVGWIWLSRISHRDPWSGLRIRLAPDEAYAYALWVEPEVRPAGVAAVLMSSMLREVHDDPALARVYGWVDSRNRESQALMRMSSFRGVQHVKRVHLLRRMGTQLPRTDRPAFGPMSRAGTHSQGAAVSDGRRDAEQSSMNTRT